MCNAHVCCCPANANHVCASNIECINRCIGEPHMRGFGAKFERHRQTNHTTARAQIDNLQWSFTRPCSCDIKRNLHNLLCLGPRNQHTLVNHDVEVPKGPALHHILQWHSTESILHHCLQTFCACHSHKLILFGRKLGRIHATRVLAQPTRLLSITQLLCC